MISMRERAFCIKLSELCQEHVDKSKLSSEEMIRALRGRLIEEEAILNFNKRCERSY